MSEKDRSQILKSSTGTAIATFLSRLLGLFRVRLEALVLGGGEIASGWFLAFAVPNLLRRLLGEGALGTALMPLVAEGEAQGGNERVRRELAVVFAVLSIILALTVIVVSGGAWIIGRFFTSSGGFWATPRMQLCLSLLPLLMPYGFFICLTGITGSVLNYARIFVRPALGALLLNIFLIGGLFWGWVLCRNEGFQLREFLPKLAFFVVLSGVIQLLLMLLLLKGCGKFPSFSLRSFRESTIISRLFKCALPGMIGGAALQVSFIVDRLLASYLGKQAVPAFVYVDRVIDLPIGIFAISLGSVLMASMARTAQGGNTTELSGDLEFGLRHVYFVCMPLAAMVIFFHTPILRLLCLGGNYTVADMAAARNVALFYGAGIPLFCSAKVILPAFYARKDMKRPFYCSLVSIVLNITLNFLLMWRYRQGGIAFATVAASLVNNGLLLLLLRRDGILFRRMLLLKSALRTSGLSLLLCGGIYWLYCRFHGQGILSWWDEFLIFTTAMTLFGLLYFLLMWLIRSPEPGEFLSMLRRRRG